MSDYPEEDYIACNDREQAIESFKESFEAKDILSCECKSSVFKPKGKGIIKDQHEFRGCTCKAQEGDDILIMHPSITVMRIK